MKNIKFSKYLLAFIAIIASTFSIFSIFDKTVQGFNKNEINIITPMKYASKNSFIEETDVFEENRDSWGYINPYYDAYPKTENTSNFHSIATATYANINGRTITVDTLYRQYNEALNDPNYSSGMLLYQCIQYKINNPNEQVNVYFSSYRTSVTAAVCLNPHSPYFGYMRSLYDCDYDNNGFVKIAYLLVEAARMGIDVTMVCQMPSYAVKQYNNETKKTYSAAEPDYRNYFNASLKYECYEKYAAGCKVSDFLNFVPVDWAKSYKGAFDVMHVKTTTVSHYLDHNGTAHRYGVWLSSTNLDANNYKGYNGNNGEQSGIIITNHKEIYQVVENYISLMSKYPGLDDIIKVRNIINERNTKQIDLILSGKENQIPSDEKIVYLGSDTDKIFQMYFTPMGGDYDTWDVIHNPYCKYFQEFYDSEDYVVFTANNPNHGENFLVSKTLTKILIEKFVNNKNPKNRLGIRSQNATFAGLKGLVAGEDLEFINFKTTWDKVHNKDFLMSYERDGKRQYVSIINSCNFNDGALFYQFNFILIVNENDDVGKIVYNSLGSVSTKGAIVDETIGTTFSANERLALKEKFSSNPLTLEADFILEKANEEVTSYGSLFSNNDNWNYSLKYRIDKDGHPSVVLGKPTPNSKNVLVFKQKTITFDEVDVCTGERTRLTIVINPSDSAILCYIDGELKQTKTNIADLNIDYFNANTFVVGGDHLGSNSDYFKGKMYCLSAYSDVRSQEEIASALDNTDSNLLVSFDFTEGFKNTYFDDNSINDNDISPIKLWLGLNNIVEVGDYAYSFAVVPDTQTLSWYYPDKMVELYDWIVANKEEHKIEYVIGLGDITEKSLDYEYEHAKEQIYKLDGLVPFSLVMGNHDKYDFASQDYMPENNSDFLFNKTFYEEAYLDELDGWYQEGDVSCSYNAFQLGETKWLLLNLDYGPTDEMLTWAGNIVSQYPDHRVIVVTHAYLYHDGTTLDYDECYPPSRDNPLFNDGEGIWDKFVSKYENIELVLCGHDPWDHIICTETEGDNGNIVTQLLIDGQYMDRFYTPTEMIALLYFSEDGKTMTVRYYSISQDMYGSELSQFTIHFE